MSIIYLELLIFAPKNMFVMNEQTNAKQLTLHIGQLIKEELEHQERTVSWFARKLYCDRSNVYKIFKRPTIDTSVESSVVAIVGGTGLSGSTGSGMLSTFVMVKLSHTLQSHPGCSIFFTPTVS